MEGVKKTQVKLTDEDGNVFNLLGLCSRALKRDGKHEEAKQLQNKVMSCHSYDEAIQAMMEFCDVR
jgi:hypothetical protein